MQADRKIVVRTGRRAAWVAVPIALLMITPLLWTLVSSLRPSSEIFAYLYPFSLRTVVPEEISFSNYVTLLQGPFAAALINTMIVTIGSVVLGLAVSAMAAYALAVIDFRGRGVVFAVVVISFMIPFEVTAIPLSSSFRDWGLANSYAGLILPGIADGLAIFLLRQFFLNIPESLAESARLDGLGWFGTFFRIYLPLSGGGLVGAGLILFANQWQAFLWPLLIAPSQDMRVASVAIADFAQEAGVDFGQMFAAAFCTALIPLVIFMVFQRQLGGALATSGSKE